MIGVRWHAMHLALSLSFTHTHTLFLSLSLSLSLSFFSPHDRCQQTVVLVAVAISTAAVCASGPTLYLYPAWNLSESPAPTHCAGQQLASIVAPRTAVVLAFGLTKCANS